MDQQEQLRERLDEQRAGVSDTVGQIENRVAPNRMMARGGWRVRRRLTDVRDRIMGNDQPGYPAHWYGESQLGAGEPDTSRTDQVRDVAGRAGDAPAVLRRQTRGNPLAAGLIAFGSGMLVAALLPETRQERDAARNLESPLRDAAARAGEETRGVVDDMRGPAREAADNVKDAGASGAQAVKRDATERADQVKDEVRR